MQESRLLRDAFAGIIRDEAFFDQPLTRSECVVPPSHVQVMLRERIAAVRKGEIVTVFYCEPFGFDAWGRLELTPNANAVCIRWYTEIHGVQECYGCSYGPWLFEEGEDFVVTALYCHMRLMHRDLIESHKKMRATLRLESELLEACGLPDDGQYS